MDVNNLPFQPVHDNTWRHFPVDNKTAVRFVETHRDETSKIFRISRNLDSKSDYAWTKDSVRFHSISLSAMRYDRCLAVEALFSRNENLRYRSVVLVDADKAEIIPLFQFSPGAYTSMCVSPDRILWVIYRGALYKGVLADLSSGSLFTQPEYDNPTSWLKKVAENIPECRGSIQPDLYAMASPGKLLLQSSRALYLMDTNIGSITTLVKFGKPGDYDGYCVVFNNTVENEKYVVCLHQKDNSFYIVNKITEEMQIMNLTRHRRDPQTWWPVGVCSRGVLMKDTDCPKQQTCFKLITFDGTVHTQTLTGVESSVLCVVSDTLYVQGKKHVWFVSIDKMFAV